MDVQDNRSFVFNRIVKSFKDVDEQGKIINDGISAKDLRRTIARNPYKDQLAVDISKELNKRDESGVSIYDYDGDGLIRQDEYSDAYDAVTDASNQPVIIPQSQRVPSMPQRSVVPTVAPDPPISTDDHSLTIRNILEQLLAIFSPPAVEPDVTPQEDPQPQPDPVPEVTPLQMIFQGLQTLLTGLGGLLGGNGS